MEGRPEEGIDLLLDLVRLSRRADEEPGSRFYGEQPALLQCRLIARTTKSPEFLASLQARLLQLGLPCPTHRRLLEREWHMLDNTLVAAPPTDEPWDRKAGRIYTLWCMRRTVILINKHKAEFYEAVEQNPDRAQRWRRAHPALDKSRFFMSPGDLVVRAANAAASRNQDYLGAVIGVALERYQRDHGAYPPALEELAPRYLDTIPNDPMTDGPFGYSLKNGKYVLFTMREDKPKSGEVPKYDIVIPDDEG